MLQPPQPCHATRTPRFEALVERWGDSATPGVIVICEHSANTLPEDIPALGGTLGLTPETRASHAAYDIGALGLARGLAEHLAAAAGGAWLAHAPLSRLVYDLNRAPDHPGAMPLRSEVHDIPGNHDLSAAQRLARVQALYLPFHQSLQAEIAGVIAQGRRPALIAVHSFTPVFHGAPRAVEFGVIHDDDTALSLAVLEAARGSELVTRLNEPYSAAGDVTHTIRLHATPYRLLNTMLEVRNDLIATPQAQAAMAARLAPVLEAGLRAVGGLRCPDS